MPPKRFSERIAERNAKRAKEFSNQNEGAVAGEANQRPKDWRLSNRLTKSGHSNQLSPIKPETKLEVDEDSDGEGNSK